MLLEVLMGMVILAMGFIMFYNLYYDTGYKFIRRARDYAIAVNISERCLNSAKAKVISVAKAAIPQLLPPGETDLTPLIKGSDTFQKSLQCAEDIHDFEVKQIVSAYGPRMLRISVVMTWSLFPRGAKTMRVCLSTYVCNREY